MFPASGSLPSFHIQAATRSCSTSAASLWPCSLSSAPCNSSEAASSRALDHGDVHLNLLEQYVIFTIDYSHNVLHRRYIEEENKLCPFPQNNKNDDSGGISSWWRQPAGKPKAMGLGKCCDGARTSETIAFVQTPSLIALLP